MSTPSTSIRKSAASPCPSCDLLHLGVLFQRPVLALQNGRTVATEHLRGLLIAFQLPVERGTGNDGKLTTVGLVVSTTMTYGLVHGDSGHVVDALEVVHTIVIGNVALAA